MSGGAYVRYVVDEFDAQFKLDAVRLIWVSDRATSLLKNLRYAQSSCSRWKRELKENPQYALPGKGKLKPEQDQLRQLQQELKRVGEERDISKKGPILLLQKRTMRYRFVTENQTQIPMTQLCHLLGMSRSAYYHGQQAGRSLREQ